MSTPYFYSVAGRLYPDKDLMKLMDTEEYFQGDPVNAELIFTEEFESKELPCFRILADSSIAACLNDSVQFVGPVIVPLGDQCNDWLRIVTEFNVQSREWDLWKYVQWNVHFYKGEEIIKTNMIKVNRYLPQDYINYPVHFDVKIPKEDFDSCRIIFWNAESKHTMLIDHLKVYCFRS